jgi:hypothetical protein
MKLPITDVEGLHNFAIWWGWPQSVRASDATINRATSDTNEMPGILRWAIENSVSINHSFCFEKTGSRFKCFEEGGGAFSGYIQELTASAIVEFESCGFLLKPKFLSELVLGTYFESLAMIGNGAEESGGEEYELSGPDTFGELVWSGRYFSESNVNAQVRLQNDELILDFDRLRYRATRLELPYLERSRIVAIAVRFPAPNVDREFWIEEGSDVTALRSTHSARTTPFVSLADVKGQTIIAWSRVRSYFEAIVSSCTTETTVSDSFPITVRFENQLLEVQMRTTAIEPYTALALVLSNSM